MSKLLLFSLLAFGAVAFGQPANSGVAYSTYDSVATPASSYLRMPYDLDPLSDSQANLSERDRICLRIHAFIFETDDDRVPKLVRETTCMPAAGTTAKKVKGNMEPKLVPATAGNSF